MRNIIIMLLMSGALLRCTNKGFYPRGKVTIYKIVRNKTYIRLFYAPWFETIWYSPGAEVSYSKDSAHMHIRILRQSIYDKSPAPLPKVLIKDTAGTIGKKGLVYDVLQFTPKVKEIDIEGGSSNIIVNENRNHSHYKSNKNISWVKEGIVYRIYG